ncbi:DNA double-strand break repair nuclease NurA [Salinibacter altiplanensis]|uniref:DNA double-strand break repair nuclease NurA n=1 Tax=Salinibacter altiplanensis TaxID=1803181 RepID=UPI000C9FEF39|nr:DNA double-strand break repair nuclease NurA [Salinibacter altiplanensis]
MLDLRQLRDQLDTFTEFQTDRTSRRTAQRDRCEALLRVGHENWKAVREAVATAQPRRLVAQMREPPAAVHAPPERPSPITVVATDGSQIYPARHVEPPFFLLNVSQVAFQYGTTEDARLDAVPRLHFREEVDDRFDARVETITTELVSALRDELELEHLLDAAVSAQVQDRPLVALADGTLIRWMVRGMDHEALEDELIARYTEHLEDIRDAGLALASYVSMPASTEVVNLLRFVGGDLDPDPPVDASEVAPEPKLDGVLDRHVLDAVLAPGERSAVFGSASHIQGEYPAGTDISFFYVKVPGPAGGEIGRVEVPRWVAETSAFMDRVHATVLQECRKGDGYPLALSEAHERAVVRASEREAFFRLMERRLRTAGLGPVGSRKRRSKQRPRV